MYILDTEGPDSKRFVRDGKRSFGNFYTWFHHKYLSTTYLILDNELLYLMIYCTMVGVAVFYDPLWSAFSLVEFGLRFPTLRNVF